MVLRKKIFALAFIFSVALTIALMSAFTLPVKAQTGTPLTLYAGEVSSSAYGFGLTASSITSPGPTLTLTEGTTYTMTVYNVSHMGMLHSWEISPTEAVATSAEWGASIDLANYIPVGGSGSVTFTPTQTGNFYYVCTFPGHIALGMWGKIVVKSSTIPEFPSVLTLMFMMLAAAGLATFLAKQQPKTKRFF